jgi:hypothetical protein
VVVRVRLGGHGLCNNLAWARAGQPQAHRLLDLVALFLSGRTPGPIGISAVAPKWWRAHVELLMPGLG